jgi:hypothetical protein
MRARRKFSLLLVFLAALACAPLAVPAAPRTRWSEQAANDWYARQPWLVGANYIPASAINQLEMWQADTFDPQRIDRELGWAESIGMNTMRVFLHDLLWQQDAKGFKHRIDTFLTIAGKHHIRPLLVLFDSVWDPTPHLGRQPDPVPGVHNSGWVQSPSAAELANPARYPGLEAYVKGVVGAFAKDRRILGWDVWNEPTVEPPTDSHWPAQEAPHKDELVRKLLPQAFKWARAAKPNQPLTSGVYASGGWSSWDKWPRTAQIQLEESDILSFHSYGKPEELTRRIESLLPYGRPILCTEYMARSEGSTLEGALPVLNKYHVGAFNWGLVAGKTQTIYPWDSWDEPYTGDHQLSIWFHDLFRPDGLPYRQEEVDLIRHLTGRGRDRSSG